ncbi:MAG: uroporphyrinogen decarboxylase family protein [Christensenellales bacterium]|jgi:uroporphyrinogen decarboxylase
MLPFRPKMTDLNEVLKIKQEPDGKNILRILRGEKPTRSTLFEFFLNVPLYEQATADISYPENTPYLRQHKMTDTFYRLGYDYINMYGNDMKFPLGAKPDSNARTTSLNSQVMITDRKSFREYPWPDPYAFPTDRIDIIRDYLHPDMLMSIYCPGGVEENLIDIVGYDNLCYMLADDPDLVKEIADEIGSRLLAYYQICAKHPGADMFIVNDDWGYDKQTLLSPSDLRHYIIPWHKKFVQTIHSHGKPAVLHSCGNLAQVMDDIIDDIGYDGKHSYEDKILPVEEAYELYHGRIAVMGGLDVDYVIRNDPGNVYARACAMLERTKDRGGYALGTGNSVPEYVPTENYLSMISAAIFNR